MGSDRFKFNDSSMSSIMSEMSREKRKLSDIESQIDSIKRNLSSSIKDKVGVSTALKKISSSVSKSQTNVNNLSKGLMTVRNNYNVTEDRVAGINPFVGIVARSVQNITSALFPAKETKKTGSVKIGTHHEEDKSGLKVTAKPYKKDYRKEMNHSKGKDNVYEYDFKKKEGKKSHESDRWEDGEQQVWDEKKKKYVDKYKDGKEQEWDEKKGKYVDKAEKTTGQKIKDGAKKTLGNATIATLGHSEEVNAIEASGKIEGRAGSLEGSVKVGHAEYNADITVSTGGVSASVGGSASVLELSGKGQLGNENLGAHAEGKVKVGSVSAKAEGKVQWLDDKGNFNPGVKAGASAEAVAASAEGKVGVDVAGVKGDVKGEIGVGVGAHANVEVSGGKIKFDVGAYVGVGGSVSVELDFSGAAKNIGKAAKSIGKAAEGAAKYVGKATKSVAKFFGF